MQSGNGQQMRGAGGGEIILYPHRNAAAIRQQQGPQYALFGLRQWCQRLPDSPLQDLQPRGVVAKYMHGAAQAADQGDAVIETIGAIIERPRITCVARRMPGSRSRDAHARLQFRAATV